MMKILSSSANEMTISAGALHSDWVERLQEWDEADISSRIWNRDGRVWNENLEPGSKLPELTDRLGWLELPETMTAALVELNSFVEEVVAAGFTQAVVLGMGGSSLIAEVWSGIFAPRPGFMPVTILDSTHPSSITQIVERYELATTLFLVASKSGGTLETLSFFNYFYHQLAHIQDKPGDNFVALTDPGSKLELLGREKFFRKIFSTPADVGGRFSALTFFGLLPAALQGVSVAELLKAAQTVSAASSAGVPATRNPALRLGFFLGEMLLAGRDKLILVLSPTIKPFAVWLEQLIAESTGKSGYGLLPVIVADEDELPLRDRQGEILNDTLYLFFQLAEDDNESLEKNIALIEEAGEPFVAIRLADKINLAQEIWRFEMATAALGAVLKINPFDQPDVEAAKIGARQAMAAWQECGKLPEPERLVVNENLKISGSSDFSGVDSLTSAIEFFIKKARPGDYVAVMVYLPMSVALEKILNKLSRNLQRCCGVPVTVGFGPRFLHSTGQLHKGDGNHGLFLQVIGDLQDDLALPPGSDYSFGTLVAAQAQGDYEALLQRNRRVLAIDFSGEAEAGIVKIVEMLENLMD